METRACALEVAKQRLGATVQCGKRASSPRAALGAKRSGTGSCARAAGARRSARPRPRLPEAAQSAVVVDRRFRVRAARAGAARGGESHLRLT